VVVVDVEEIVEDEELVLEIVLEDEEDVEIVDVEELVLVVVVAIVSGVKEYKCPIAGLTFKTLAVLLNHNLILESLAAGSLHLDSILGYLL